MKRGYASGKRLPLKECLPLDYPLGIQLYIVRGICNLKCEFCSQSIAKEPATAQFMPFELFEEFILQLQANHWTVKQIMINGIGEPLLHPDICRMIKAAKQAKICESITVITNGVRLNKKMVDDLIEAGIDSIRISVNGLSDADYKKYTSTEINFTKFVMNLRYLYSASRNHAKIYIKIMDYMLQDDKQHQLLYDTFHNISDELNVEHVFGVFEDVDYSKYQVAKEQNYKTEDVIKFFVCPLPFFNMVIDTNGDIAACGEMIYNLRSRYIYGTIGGGIYAAWNSSALNTLQVTLLEKGKKSSPYCVYCEMSSSCSFHEDCLDDDVPRLLCVYTRKDQPS